MEKVNRKAQPLCREPQKVENIKDVARGIRKMKMAGVTVKIIKK